MGALLTLAPSLATASLQADIPLPTPVQPEPYPNSDIYAAVVYLASQHDLQILYALNIDFEDLRPVTGMPIGTGAYVPAIATVYINPGQADALIQQGLTPVPIPNEGYRSFLDHGPGTKSPPGWPTFEQYVARMQALEAAHPNIVDLVQIGTSVEGRGLYCMEVTEMSGLAAYGPEFKYTANHHGDETTGIEMTMRLAEYLANNYGTDPLITDLVDKMEIWLCPIYNPDGYVHGTRYNYNGVDLNRDFPDRFTDPIDNPAGREPETQAFMNFGYAHRFVMGANYHGGEQVLNYPFDAIANPNKPEYAPDDSLFYTFGIGYTSRNPDLWNNPAFPHGITRGWEWYMINGGMQDWAYYYHGEHHVTLEISWEKSPGFNTMDGFWDRNREAMLWWMQQAGTGLAGLVLDARDTSPLDATVTLVGRGLPNTIRTDPEVGDYHRVISAGLYTLRASAVGYHEQSMEVLVNNGEVNGYTFTLCPSDPWIVSGTVTDVLSGLPLEAYIEFIGSYQVTHTDPATGQYSIPICHSTYTMRVSAEWYYPEERLVTIDHNQTQDFALQPTPNLSYSNKQSSAIQVLPGDLVHYQLHAVNSGSTASAMVTDTLPAELTWAGELTATQGIPVFNQGQILWQGDISATQPVTISYAVNVNPCLPAGTNALNNAEFADGVNGVVTGKVQLEVINAVPGPPTAPNPANGALDQPIRTALSWAPSSDLNCEALTYDLVFGTLPNPVVVASGLTAPSFDPGILQPGTTYYWLVIVHDGFTALPGPFWNFTTAVAQQVFYLPITLR
jgi:carboxypeptidase D